MIQTNTIGLKKPEKNEFIDIGVLNENFDKIDSELEKVENPQFDDSGTVPTIQSFTDFVNSIKSKMNILDFYRNLKAGMKYVLHTGKLINNTNTTEAGFALDARVGKYLQDQVTTNKNDAISKTSIVNNVATTVGGTVLDGRVGKYLQEQITEQNNNLENKIDLNNTGFFIGGEKHFAFLQIKQEQNVTRLQIESNEAKIYKSTDGAISFPYCERLLTIQDKPIFQLFIFNPNGSTDIELTLAHNAQTHTVYASNGDINAYTGFVIGTQLVNNTNKLRILLSKQHWGNIRIQVMYMKS